MTAIPLSKNLRRVGRLEIPGGGQVVVQDGHAYVGHMKPPEGTSIVDVRDPANPRLVTTLSLPNEHSHTHKVRVVGDIMIANVEQNDRHALRRSLAALRETEARFRTELGRDPSEADLAKALSIPEALVPRLRHTAVHGYEDGGFRVFDVSNKAKPRELAYVHTGGIGVHRFDMDSRYAYISTEMEGFQGNILVVYDIADPTKPTEVSRWWMPGQNLAAGEKPFWKGQSNRLHHALRFGDELWAAVWYAGIRVIDAVDEEHDHREGQLHGGLWFLDVEDRANIKYLGMYHLSELKSPFARKGRFGAHQFQERVTGDRLFCTWFSGGLRMLDISDPTGPEEIGWYIPEPGAGQDSPQSNDVFLDERGLVYLIDRNVGLDILEVVN
jgi:hypothetical protein